MLFHFGGLIAVAAQGINDALCVVLAQNRRSAKISFAFVRHPRGQVARAGRAMLDLSVGGDSEPFLGSLVSFLLGHDVQWAKIR